MEDQGAHGHGQVGPAHAGLAAEEQRGRGSAGVPQQQAGALLGGRDTGMDRCMDGCMETSVASRRAPSVAGMEVMAMPTHGGVGGISLLLRGAVDGAGQDNGWPTHCISLPRALSTHQPAHPTGDLEMFPPLITNPVRFHLPESFEPKADHSCQSHLGKSCLEVVISTQG